MNIHSTCSIQINITVVAKKRKLIFSEISGSEGPGKFFGCVRHIRALAKSNHEAALPRLQMRCSKLDYTDSDFTSFGSEDSLKPDL